METKAKSQTNKTEQYRHFRMDNVNLVAGKYNLPCSDYDSNWSLPFK